MLDLASFASGGLGATVVGGMFFLIRLIVNKRLRTPADELAIEKQEIEREKQAIAERNDLLASYRTALEDANRSIKRVQEGLDAANSKLAEANRQASDLQERMETMEREWLEWGYAAVHVIREHVGETHIPRPAPAGLRIIRREDA